MEIKVWIERNSRTQTVSFSGRTVEELLTELAINPETVIVSRNKEVLTEKEVLRDKDALELLSVISGG